MEITYNNPGQYKTESKPALHIFFAWILSSLVLTGLTLLFVPDVGAKNHDWCDAMYSELFYKEVPSTIQKECKNRFIYNVNKIKRSFPLNYNKF